MAIIGTALAIAFAIPASDPTPARDLPVHQLDERQAGGTLVAEAGDRIVIRLRERQGSRWLLRPAPVGPLIALAEPADRAGADGYRRFTYQVRGAGEAELVFAQSGSAAVLRFRIVSR